VPLPGAGLVGKLGTTVPGGLAPAANVKGFKDRGGVFEIKKKTVHRNRRGPVPPPKDRISSQRKGLTDPQVQKEKKKALPFGSA